MADKSFGVRQLNIIESIESQNSTLNINATTVAISTNLTVSGGDVGIGTTNPNAVVGASNTSVLAVGVVTANNLYGSGENLTSYKYTSLTGIQTQIFGDTAPKLGGDLDGNSKSISDVNNLFVTGSVGIGTTNTSSVDSTNTKALAVGIVTSYDSFNTNIVTDKIRLGHHVDVKINDDVNPSLQLVGVNTESSTLAIYRYEGNNESPTLSFVKSRNASPGNNSIVQTGDELGKITFNGDDGSDIDNAGAEIKAIVGTSAGSDTSDMPGSLVFLTSPDNENTPQEALRIDYNQDVGIGTAVPTDAVTNQQALLAVAGIITAHKLYVGNLEVTGTGSGLNGVVEDTTPQLGGDLDGNSKSIDGIINLKATGITTVGFATATDVWVSGAVTATSFKGSGTNLTSLNATNLESGTINVARLGSGADGTKFLRGDNTWHVPDTSPNIGINSNGTYVGTASTINFTTGDITVTNDIANVSVGSSVHFVGADVYFSTGTPSTGAYYYVSAGLISAVRLDTNSFYNASNGRYEIPAGVTKVRLRANVWSDDGSGAVSNVWRAYKNGSPVYINEGGFFFEAEVNSGFGDIGASGVSGVLSVSEGDYIQLAYQVSSNTRSFAGSWQLEVVEGSLLGHYFASTNVTNSDNITVQANNTADETVYPIFVDGATGIQGPESDTGFTYNPSSGTLTATTFSGSISVGTGATVHSPSSNVITLGTNNTEKLRIDSSGRTLIGHTASVDTSSYNSNLQVMGTNADGSSITVGRFSYDASASSLNLTKSRGATVGIATSLSNNDVIGNIFWWGSDGGDYEEVAHIGAQAGAAFTSGSTPGDLTFWTTPVDATVATEKLRITSGGQTLFTGVSGTTPLDIKTSNSNNNSVQPIIEAYSDNNTRKAQIALARESLSKENGLVFLTSTNADSDSQERLRITSAGNVGIGTDNPVGAAATTGNTKVLAVGIVTANEYWGDGSKLSNITAGATQTTGDFSGLIKEEVRIDADRLDEDENINLADGMIHYFEDPEDSSSTPNIRFDGSTTLTSKMTVGQAITVTIITRSDASSGSVVSNAIKIDGDDVTEEWLCATAPSTPSATSGYNVYTHTIIKKGSSGTTANDFLVLSTVANYD